MSQLGTFSNGGLGFGLNFTLRDFFSNTARNIERRMHGLGKSSDKMADNVVKAFNRVKTGIVLAGIGTAIVMGFKPAVIKSMEFNKVLSGVEAKVSELDVSMAVLKNTALDLGTKTKFTATEAGEGMEFLAMTGLKASQIIQGMPGLLNLAAAGDLELSRSADIATNIMTALGMKAGDLTRISDVLAKVITTSNVNMEQLGYTMKFAAPRAGQLGVSLEKLAGLSGILGDVGIQGTIAGTSLREFFTNLARVKEKGKLGAFGQLGLGISDIVDKNGNMQDTVVIMDKLLSKFRGMGNIEAASLATKIFGVGGDSVIAALLSKSSKDFAGYAAQLENAEGTALRVADKMLDNFAGDMTKLKSIIDTTLIRIGDSIEPILRPFAQGLAAIVGWFSVLAENPAGRFLIQVAAVIGGLLLTLGALKIALGLASLAWTFFGAAAMTALVPLLPFIAVIAGIVIEIAAVIYVLNKAVKAFDAMETPAKGFLGFLQRLGGYVRTIQAVWKSWDSLTQTFSLTGELRNKLQKLGILETAINIGTWVVRVKELFKGIYTGVMFAWGIIKSVLSTIKNAFSSMFDVIGINIDKNISSLKTWANVGKVIGAGLVAILSLIALKFLIIGINALIAFSPVLIVIAAVGLAIWGLIKLWDVFGESITNFFGRIGSGFNFLYSKLKDVGSRIMTGIWEGIKSIIPMIIRGLEMIPGIGLMLQGIRLLGGTVSNYFGGEDSGKISPVSTPTQNAASMQNDFEVTKATTPVMLNPNFTMPKNSQPIIVNSVLELDGETVAKKVNEVNELNDNLQ